MENSAPLPHIEANVMLYRDPVGSTDLLGFADVVIARHVVIKGIRIIMGKAREDKPAGPFLAYPAKKGTGAASDKWFDIAHPITAEARQAINEVVLRAYAKAAASKAQA